MDLPLVKPAKRDGVNIIWLVLAVIGLSLAMVVVSFMIFLKSSAYDTVKTISIAGQALAEDDLGNYDTKSPIQAKDIDQYYQSLKSRLNAIENQEDYNDNAINEQSLGY